MKQYEIKRYWLIISVTTYFMIKYHCKLKSTYTVLVRYHGVHAKSTTDQFKIVIENTHKLK